MFVFDLVVDVVIDFVFDILLLAIVPRVSVSPCLPVSLSAFSPCLRPRVSVSPRLRVSASLPVLSLALIE